MLYDRDTFEHAGHTFVVTFPYNDSGETPWEREDGHGPVSDWRTAEGTKRPGERALSTDRHSARFYDFAEACRIARRDGWGCEGGRKEGETLRAYAARAADADFQRLRAWCNDQWSYVGVVVTLLDNDGEEVASDSLWGIESDSGDYLESTAHELADQILAELPDPLVEKMCRQIEAFA